jgi:hypothetical protein
MQRVQPKMKVYYVCRPYTIGEQEELEFIAGPMSFNEALRQGFCIEDYKIVSTLIDVEFEL